MIIKTIGEYQIEISPEESYNKSNPNLHKYNQVYFEDSEYNFPTAFGIKTFKGNQLLKSVIIGSNGGGTGIEHKNAMIFEHERILICCSDSIFCLSIPDLNLLWQTHADQACCFEIFKYQDSYIVHGEIEISRLDKDGNIIWQESGADIFTTISGEQSFELTDNFIIAKDFENRVYKWNYNGEDFTDKTQF